jgi:hypothetical protein
VFNVTEKTIEQLKKAIRMNDALFNKIGNGEISTKKAGSIFERQLSFEVNKALKMALEELSEVE